MCLISLKTNRMEELAKIAVKLLLGAIAVATGGVLLKHGAEDAYNFSGE